jgi:hypothetical protein
MAEDSVKVDPKLYSRARERGRAGRESPLWSGGKVGHAQASGPRGGVFDRSQCKFSYRSGKTEEVEARAGEVHWFGATEHVP